MSMTSMFRMFEKGQTAAVAICPPTLLYGDGFLIHRGLFIALNLLNALFGCVNRAGAAQQGVGQLKGGALTGR